MNKIIKEIIDRRCTKEEKDKALALLNNDIEMAKGILSGKFQYCPECDDYYLSESYLTRVETKETKICVYEDPINSGGNNYIDGYVDIIYSICPKGHRHEIFKEITDNL